VNPDFACTQLLKLMSALELEREGPPRDRWRAALSLEHAAMCDLVSPDDESRILAEPRIKSRLASCQKMFSDLETTIERSVTEVIRLDGSGGIWADADVSQHYLARYEYLARREIELAGIRANERVLFIGSGFLPITAFEYARQTGCSVDCVDFVEEAIECSRRTAEVLRLTNRMRFYCVRG
jgi:hypothetical protein